MDDLKPIGTTAIHGTNKNVPPDVIPENWGLLTVSANTKNGQVGCTQHLSIMVTEGYFPQIYERNWNSLNWSKWARIATATPPQEYNIPFQSGWHAAAKTTYCKTQEEVCVVNCSASGSGVASSNFIATLPAGFRPPTTVCATAHVYKNGVRGIAEVHIGSGGDIVVYSPIEFDSVSFGVSFVVAI